MQLLYKRHINYNISNQKSSKLFLHPLHRTHTLSCEFRHIADDVAFPQQGYDFLVLLSFLFDSLY